MCDADLALLAWLEFPPIQVDSPGMAEQQSTGEPAYQRRSPAAKGWRCAYPVQEVLWSQESLANVMLDKHEKIWGCPGQSLLLEPSSGWVSSLITDLVDGDPKLDPVAEPLEQHLGIRDKILYNLVLILKAAISLLQLQRVIPVEDGYGGLDALRE